MSIIASVTYREAPACPSLCPECSTHPDHNVAAYEMGVGYGQRYVAADLASEIAYTERRILSANRLALPFLQGIRDGLAQRLAGSAAS